MTEKSTPIRIVCIEDEPEMIDLVKLILTRKINPTTGENMYSVHGAGGGKLGLELIQQVQPDLVLLDLMMPDMDGWEVYQNIRSNDAMKELPVIIITAKAQSIDKVLGLHIAKVNDYVTKPFGPKELMSSVEKVLQDSGRLVSE
jgi:two-component system, OmpR family, response regulator VicR